MTGGAASLFLFLRGKTARTFYRAVIGGECDFFWTQVRQMRKTILSAMDFTRQSVPQNESEARKMRITFIVVHTLPS